MPVKIAANGAGGIFYSEGDIDDPYGIASLGKIWAAALLHDRMKSIAARRKISLDGLLDEKVAVTVDYESMIYSRMEPRPDLVAPDDPLVYRPFRREKARFRLPAEKGKSYTARALFEAALFLSKNDAIQALADAFFADDDNRSFRAASADLARKIGLRKTKIGDPHGLCDGDNISTGRELAKFGAFLIQDGHMEFFGKFDPAGKEHSARRLLGDGRLAQRNIHILLAKTATGNDRHGNDTAESLMAVARMGDQFKIALTLSDENRFDSVVDLLVGKSI